jgi:hypothetical protein
MPCANNREFEIEPDQVGLDTTGFCEMGKFEPLATQRLLKLLDRFGIRHRTVNLTKKVLQRGGPIKRKMIAIQVPLEDRRRANLICFPPVKPTNAIRNCKVELSYVCPRDWEELDPTNEPATRFCQQCREMVILCSTDFEAINHAGQGHCIAMAGEDGTAKFLLKMGRPPPLTSEQKSMYVAYRIDEAKTQALRNLTESSKFCTSCGYPMPEDSSECTVCAAKKDALLVYLL